MDKYADLGAVHAELKIPQPTRAKIRRWVDSLDWPEGAEKEDQREYHVTVLTLDKHDEAFVAWMRRQIKGRSYEFDSDGLDVFGDVVVLRLSCAPLRELAIKWGDIAYGRELGPRRFPGGPKAHVTVGFLDADNNTKPRGIQDPNIGFTTGEFNVNINKTSAQLMRVYHGTHAGLLPQIEDEGLLPRNKWDYEVDEPTSHDYAHVTTDPERAKNFYAKAHAANAYAKGEIEKPQGAVLAYDIHPDSLEPDPYNPGGEPNQYVVHGGVQDLPIAHQEIVDFPELEDPAKLAQWRALHVGIDKWAKTKGVRGYPLGDQSTCPDCGTALTLKEFGDGKIPQGSTWPGYVYCPKSGCPGNDYSWPLSQEEIEDWKAPRLGKRTYVRQDGRALAGSQPASPLEPGTPAFDLKEWLDSIPNTPQDDSFGDQLTPHHQDAMDILPTETPVTPVQGPHTDPPAHPWKPYDWAKDASLVGEDENASGKRNHHDGDQRGTGGKRQGAHPDVTDQKKREHKRDEPNLAEDEEDLPDWIADDDYQQAKHNWYDRAWANPGSPTKFPPQPMHWRHDHDPQVKSSVTNPRWIQFAHDMLETLSQAGHDIEDGATIDQVAWGLVNEFDADYEDALELAHQVAHETAEALMPSALMRNSPIHGEGETPDPGSMPVIQDASFLGPRRQGKR